MHGHSPDETSASHPGVVVCALIADLLRWGGFDLRWSDLGIAAVVAQVAGAVVNLPPTKYR